MRLNGFLTNFFSSLRTETVTPGHRQVIDRTRLFFAIAAAVALLGWMVVMWSFGSVMAYHDTHVVSSQRIIAAELPVANRAEASASAEKAAAWEKTQALEISEGKRVAEERAREDKAYLKTRAGRIWSKHQDWDRDLCEKIAHHQISIGMNVDQVHAALGLPDAANVSQNAFGYHSQLVYPHLYVYLDGGIAESHILVTSITHSY